LEVGAERYFVERDGELFRKFFASALKLGELAFAEPNGSTSTSSKCTIRLITRPEIASWVPESVRQHVTRASEIEFHDDLVYDAEDLAEPPYSISICTSSPFLGDRMRLRATMTFVPLDERSCEHRYEGEIACRMFGFGVWWSAWCGIAWSTRTKIYLM
jgi:hypothetical protein